MYLQALQSEVQTRRMRLLLPKTDSLIHNAVGREEGYFYKVVTEQCRGTRAEAEVRGAGDNIRTVVGKKRDRRCLGLLKSSKSGSSVSFSYYKNRKAINSRRTEETSRKESLGLYV